MFKEESKEIKELEERVSQLKNSKYKEIKGPVNFGDFEMSVNNICIEFVESHNISEASKRFLVEPMKKINAGIIASRETIEYKLKQEHRMAEAAREEKRLRVAAEIRENEARKKAVELIEDREAMARMLFQEQQECQRASCLESFPEAGSPAGLRRRTLTRSPA